MDIRADKQPSVSTAVASHSAGNTTTYQGKEITALPQELIEKVFANLEGRDLVVCQRVAKAWHGIINTSPLLARAFYRRCHPLSSEPQSPLPRGMDNSCAETLGWLTRFSNEGSRSAARLEKLLAQGQPRYLMQQLFFTTARVLAQAKVFDHCYVCPIRCSKRVWSACLSPDQRHLVASCDDDTVAISRRRNGWWQQITTLAHRGPVNADNFSPNGDYFIAHGRDDTAQIWETFAEQWRLQTTFPHNYLRTACISPDGHFLILNGVDNSAEISRQVDGQWQEPVPLPNSEHMSDPSFASLNDILVTRHRRTTLKIWRLVEPTWQLDGTIEQPSSQAGKVAQLSPDGQRLYIGYLGERTIQICYRADSAWRTEATLQPTSTVYNIQISPKGDHLVAKCYDQAEFPRESEYTVNIWRFSDHQWQEVVLLNTNQFRHACFSPDGAHLLVLSTGQLITLWKNVAEQWQQQALLPDLGKVSGASFSPHGYLAIAGEKTITIWGIRAGRWQRQADLVHDIPIHRVTFSVDGQCILSQHGRGDTVNIWTLRCKDSGDISGAEPYRAPVHGPSSVTTPPPP